MTEKLLKYKQHLLAVLIFEVIISALLFLLFQELAFALFMVVVLLSSLLLGALFLRLFRQVEDDAMTISKAIGTDAKNAFLFGFVGMIMYDDKHVITWASELFDELDWHVLGMKLEDWQPRFRNTFDDDEVTTMEIEGRYYEVYNNQDSHMLYLKDVSNYTTLYKAYREQKPVMLYLSVDNFDEVINSVDEQKGALLQSSIRTTLAQWAKEYQIVLKRYRQENYIGFLNDKIFSALVDSKFVILNRVREQASSLGTVMSLSIGISKTNGLKNMDEDANDALSLAFSRGGDQVVVKTEGEPLRFFGGNSETYAKNNRVRVRVIANSLNGLFKPASNVFVMGHKESDLDSFGASIGMARIARMAQKDVYIIIDPDSMEDKTRRAFHLLQKQEDYSERLITPARAMELINKESLLISVDNHKPSLAIAKELVEACSNIVVIDHHRRGEEFMARPILTYLEPAASSTVELITEFYEYMDHPVHLSELEATIMYAGLLVDTSSFKTRTGVRTFRVAATLKELGANVSHATELLQDDYVFTLKKAEFVQSAARYNEKVLIACGREDVTYSRVMLAKVGNELLDINETEASFVIGRVDEGTVAISSRSNGKINVQVIMEKMGGGGHFSMAACQVKNSSVMDVRKRLVEKLDEYYSEREE